MGGRQGVGRVSPLAGTAHAYSRSSLRASQPGPRAAGAPSSSGPPRASSSSSQLLGNPWGQGTGRALGQAPSSLGAAVRSQLQHLRPWAAPLTCAVLPLGPFPPPLGRLPLAPEAAPELRSGDEGE